MGSHAVLHSAAPHPLLALLRNPSPNPNPSPTFLPFRRPSPSGRNPRLRTLTASATPPGAVERDPRDALERCFFISLDSGPPSCSSAVAPAVAPSPVMKGEYGAFGSVTLEKSKLDLSKKSTKSSPEV